MLMSFFPFGVFIYTNPVSLFLYFLVFEIGLKVVTVIRHDALRTGFKQRSQMYIFLMLVSTMIYARILFTNDYRRSPVDISPLIQLTDNQISYLEDALEMFREFDFMTRVENSERDDHSFLSKYAHLSWFNDYSALIVSVHYYRDEQEAKRVFRTRAGRNTNRRRGYTLDNGIEGLLFDSRMPRGGLGFPMAHRVLRSELRLGNVIINLTETLDSHHLRQHVSSDFIQLLSELLIEKSTVVTETT